MRGATRVKQLEGQMKILLAVDDSKFSQAAMQAVIAQAAPKDTTVLLLHVIEPVPAAYGGSEWGYPIDWQAVSREQRKQAETLLTQAAKTLRDAGFTVATAIEDGSAKSVIVDSAAKWPADLIVMGSHGLKGLDHFLLGSVSESVARHAPCSVQIVRIPKR
jgi:nucleotide-binding universal stress UspA family protein